MIRSFAREDIDAVMSIWLNANIEAHAFIVPEYWRDNFDLAKRMIPQAEVYVSVNNQEVDGFIGITGDYIAGIFVDKKARNRGIGSGLLKAGQKDRKRLHLKVYKKNASAVDFYRKKGFKIDAEDVDTQTSEIEYRMVWENKSACLEQKDDML